MLISGLMTGALALAAGVSVALAWIVGQRRAPGARPFAWMMISVAVWCLAYGAELAGDTLAWMLFWLRIEYLGIPFVGVFWFIMLVELSRGEAGGLRRFGWLLAPAAAVSLLALANPWLEWVHAQPRLDLTGPLPLLRFTAGPVYAANLAYTWILLAAGFVILYRARQTHGAAFRAHARTLVLAAAMPAAVNLAYLAGLRPWGVLDLSPFTFTITGAVLAWGIYRKALFDLVPVARARVVEAMADGVLTLDPQGRLLDANAAARRMLGPLSPTRPPAESLAAWPRLAAALSGEGTTLCPFGETPGGGAWAVTVSAFDDRRGARGRVAVIRDISEQERAEDELVRRERLLEALAESARRLLQGEGAPQLDALVETLGPAVGADRAYVFVNDLREDGELCMTLAAEWCAEGLAPQVDNPLLQHAAYREVGAERWLDTLSRGDTIHGVVRGFPLEERAALEPQGIQAVLAVPVIVEGTFSGFIGFDNCRTESLWSRAEQEFLRGAAMNLAHALRRHKAEESMRQAQKLETIGRLAGGIAHEFNNLLQVINGYAGEIMRGLDPSDPRASDAAAIHKAGERAATLTRKLLALSRRQMARREAVDVRSLLKDMEPMLRRLLGERVQLVLLGGEIRSLIEADPSHVEQVVLNLAVNSRDAMPSGGTLKLEVRAIAVGRDQAEAWDLQPGPHVALIVRDTGVGLSPEVRAHLFEPFFTTKPPGQGTGLGLATVYGIVKQHGGHVFAKSEAGRGAAFTILFPAAPASATGGAAPAAAPASRTEEGRERVLVVEDEALVRGLLGSILRGAGYTVLEAENGEAALLAARTAEPPVDAAISDVVMPGMSGPELAAALRSKWPDLRILFISGYAADEFDRQGISLGDVPVVRKPVAAEQLLRCLRELLNGPSPISVEEAPS